MGATSLNGVSTLPYVITQSCCNDASCAAVCPADCIHPTVHDPDFQTSEALYIDPDACIECGACVEQCPVDAIVPHDRLRPDQRIFLELSTDYYKTRPAPADHPEPRYRTRSRVDCHGIRVAVVGTGPAGMYTVWALLEYPGIEIDLYDAALTPYGLIRNGVAPDHPATKAVTTMFDRAARRPNVHMHLGVRVGRDISNAELLAHHSAVVYATGAAGERRTGIPGSNLAGVHTATEFVGWYNGNPSHSTRPFDLSGRRAVVVGNGNVALDVARVLLGDPATLAATDIADHALDALSHSNIREVVLLGRRGPAQAAYTRAEFAALGHIPGLQLSTVEADGPADTPAERSKAALAQRFAHGTATPGANRRIVSRYLVSPVRYAGNGRVQEVHIAHNTLYRTESGDLRPRTGGTTEVIDADLVLESVGYRADSIDDVPFDPVHSVIPNRRGRVVDADGNPVEGMYVTGWAKRGPSGVIGTNRACAAETVDRLIEDVIDGTVRPAVDRTSLVDMLTERRPDALTHAAWARIDAAERLAGQVHGRPRRKFTDIDELRRAAD